MKNIGNIRTDLALEAREALTTDKEPDIDGVIYKTEKDDIMEITTVDIENETGSQTMGKPVGTYITIESEYMRDNDIQAQKKITEALSQKLGELINLKRIKKPL